LDGFNRTKEEIGMVRYSTVDEQLKLFQFNCFFPTVLTG